MLLLRIHQSYHFPEWNRELEIDRKNEFEAAKEEKANEWEPSTNMQGEIVCSRSFCHAHQACLLSLSLPPVGRSQPPLRAANSGPRWQRAFAPRFPVRRPASRGCATAQDLVEPFSVGREEEKMEKRRSVKSDVEVPKKVLVRCLQCPLSLLWCYTFQLVVLCLCLDVIRCLWCYSYNQCTNNTNFVLVAKNTRTLT